MSSPEAGQDNHYECTGWTLSLLKIFWLFSPLCRYSSVRAYAKMVAETNDLAGQREVIAESMKSEVMEPLKHVMRDLTSERKKVGEEGKGLCWMQGVRVVIISCTMSQCS